MPPPRLCCLPKPLDNAKTSCQNLIFETSTKYVKRDSIFFAPNLDANHCITRLLSWKVLCPKWIALFIIADSTIMVTLVVFTCMIGFPRFAIFVSKLMVRLKGKPSPHDDFHSAIRQRFLRILYSLGKAIFTGLHGERWSCPALGYCCRREPHCLTTLCDRLLQVHLLDDFVT